MEYMESYHQMTFDEYLAIKQTIKNKIQGMAADYICIGFYLRQLEENQAYRQDGYRNLTEFAKAEYGLSASATSRFIDINKVFSVNGYSDRLLPELEGYGVSKLSEMLQLTETDRELVKIGTTVADIREMKKINRGEAAEGELVEAEVLAPSEVLPGESEQTEFTEDEEDFRTVLLAFFEDEESRLLRVWENINNPEKVSEIMAPSGNKTFRKGLYMLFLYGYGEGVALKVFRKENRKMNWEELTEVIEKLYRPYAERGNVWKECYQKHEDTCDVAKQEDTENTCDVANIEEQNKTGEIQSKSRENEQLEGQKNIAEYFDEKGDYQEPEEDAEDADMSTPPERTEVTRDKTVSLTMENGEIYWEENGIILMHEAGDGVILSMDSMVSEALANGCTVKIVIHG